MAQLDGTAIAMIARGSELDRAIAVALADAGADIAIGSQSLVQEEEFGTASIANEVWAIGREQFSHVLDASNVEAVKAYIAEVRRQLGHCDLLVVVDGTSPVVAAAKEAVDVVVVVEGGEDAADAVRRVVDAAGGRRE